MINIFYDFAGLIISFLMCMFLIKQIENADPESGLHLYTQFDGGIFILQLLISNILVNFRFSGIIDRIFFMLMIGIMIVHAYTDKKTKTVYRPFNKLMWIIGALYTAIKLFIFKEIPQADATISFTIGCIIIFLFMIYIFTFVIHTSGKGDGYMLIGLALFIWATAYNTIFITLMMELLYYVCAGLIQIFGNIKKIEIKKLRFKEKLPFAPALLYGIWAILIISYIFTTPGFINWQLAHLY